MQSANADSNRDLDDEAGRVIGAVAAAIGVPARKEAEARVRESEERFAAIFGQATAGLAETDLEGRFTLVNDRYCAIVGRTREELLGLRMQDITHPEDLPRNLALFEGAVITGKPFVIEKRYLRPDGGVLWVNNSVTLIRDRSGSPQSALAVSIDVTARKEAEQSALRLVSIVESSDDAIVSKDTEGIIATWNRGAERLFGYSAEEVVGKPITILIPPDRQHEEPAILARILRGERIEHFETVRRRKDGSAVEISLSLSPVRDPQGRIVGAAKIARDITERKRAERRLSGQKRILEMVATGAPLSDTLDELMRFMEAQEPGARCGILIVTDDGAHFRRGSGPSLPEAYHRALDGVAIDPPYLGSCGQAADEDAAVVVPDVANETRFSDAWRELLLSCGVAACRSTPVRGTDGRVLASLALYYDRPRDPTPADPGLVESATHLASIALERKRSEEALDRDLAATQRLQHISALLIREGDIEALYDEILAAAMAVMQADMASMQMLDSQRSELRLLAWEGFSAESAAFWERVHLESGSSCGVALKSGQRVVVPDIESCDFILGTPHFDAYRKSDIRAMQSTPLLSRSGRLLGMISTHWRAPHRPSERDLRLLDVLVRQVADLIERSQAEAALRESEERFRGLVEASAQIVWTADAAGAVVEDSPSWRAFTGQTPEQRQGLGWLDALHPDDRKRVSRAWRNAVAGKRGIEIEYRLRHSGGEWRWMTVRATPVFAEGGALKAYVGMNIDITERKQAEERQRLLARELDHRAKNLLAVVQSILQLSRGDDVAAFAAVVKGRIMALARALGLLSQSRWQGADLDRLVEDELAPYRTGKGRIATEGPPLTLRPAAAQSMALALHELATNAAKYGALSSAAGRLAVVWQATDEDGLTLTWTETGGPPVAATPTRRGFGSTVIGASVEQQLGGSAAFNWRPEGLRATLTVPHAQLAEMAPAAAGARRKAPAAVGARGPAAGLAGRRVLLVEDEALIAMDIETALTEQGCTVVGPASSLAEALALVGRETFDAAIVDRNLGGASSHPVAAALRERGIPFVVVTGYGDAGLPIGFDDVPLLAKPFALADLTALVARRIAGPH